MNVLLAVPRKGNSVQELKFFLSKDNADLYIFPEGFLNSNVLQEAIDIIKEKGNFPEHTGQRQPEKGEARQIPRLPFIM